MCTYVSARVSVPCSSRGAETVVNRFLVAKKCPNVVVDKIRVQGFFSGGHRP